MALPQPSEEAFGQALSAAIGSVSPDIRSRFSVPVGITYDVVNEVIEAATGVKPGDYIYGPVAKLAARVVQDAMAGALDGAVADGLDAFGPALGRVLNELGGLLDVVPMLGDFVMTWVNAVDEHEAAQAARLERMKEAERQRCGLNVRVDRPLPTGPFGETTPADLFRAVAEQSGRGQQGMPFSVATMFVMLCGGQSRSVFDFPRDVQDPQSAYLTPEESYQRWLARARQLYGSGIGIDKATRRTMWMLIEGIMAARRPYTLEYVDPIGDQGRQLFSMLCDIVLHEYQVKRSWTPQSIQGMFCYIAPHCCAHVDMGATFESSMMDWKSGVQPAGWTDFVNLARQHAELKQAQQRSLLRSTVVFSPERTVQLIGKAKKDLQLGRPEARLGSAGEAVLLASAAAGGGYLAWTAAKRWGKWGTAKA